ncbi:DUF6541 family protein [Cryobacterium tagatosivorans]|uniref:Uncharacterized protein n=1 Tax=Cryobacterium tagatosivorans TaxID=1259199 RepID=A0A4V3I7G5_9MICO|nr:DUF6541 family protein [Cryobacterium tagatosivorans]TFB53943.1 hypothetical protein E3O23_04435 [Cryobacterium tagatosivorans]
MSWSTVLPAFALITALLYMPGLALAAAVGARRFLLVAVAPAVTVAFLAVAAILFPFPGIPWQVLPVAVAALVTAVVLGLLRWALIRRSPAREPRVPSGDGWWVAGAIAIGAIIIAVQFCGALGAPERISQTFDAAFHLNAVRYILDHGDASSMHISDLILPPGRTSFYPAAWHDYIALGATLTGVSVPVAVNLGNLAVAAIAWPAATVLLIRVLVPGSRVALVGVGVLSAALPGFPLRMLSYGVLYPYFLALVFLPIAFALGFMLLGSKRGTAAQVVERIILLATVLTAIGLAQPAVVFAWFACTIPLVITRYLEYMRARPGRTRAVIVSVVIGGGLLVFAAAWVWFGRIGANSPWPDYTNVFGALYETLTYAVDGKPIAVALGALTIIGLIHLSRHREKWWIAGMWAVAALLFMSSASLPSWSLRALTVGLFYRDPPRLASLLAVVALPIAVIGLVSLWSFLLLRVWPPVAAKFQGRSRAVAARVGVAASLAILIVATQGAAMREAVHSISRTHALEASSPLVSIDELALLERLREDVPEGSVIAGNPWTGTSFAYAISGREVLNPNFNSHTDPGADLINKRLRNALSEPEVCDVVRSLNVDYVLDFGTYSRDAGKTDVRFDGVSGYVGLLDLADTGIVTPVDSEGTAVLYKITACG